MPVFLQQRQQFRNVFIHLFICNVCTSLVKIIFAELKGYIDGDHVRFFFRVTLDIFKYVGNVNYNRFL